MALFIFALEFLNVFWRKSNLDWAFWTVQISVSIAMIILGVLGFVYKVKVIDFIKKIEAKTPSFNRPIIIPYEVFLILVILTGIVGIVVSLRFILLGCPAPGC